MISSSSNAKVKQVVLLKKKGKARKEKGAFLVEGIKMVEEAYEYGILEAYVSESAEEELKKAHGSFLNKLDYELVADKVFAEMSDTITPQGILAVVKMPSYQVDDIIKSEHAHVMVLENLRDPGNLGTILRSGEGAGVTGVILSKESVDIFNPKVIRSTMGSIFRVPFCYVEDLASVIGEMKQNGITLYAAHLKGTDNYEAFDYEKSCGFLIGNEANGLSDEISKEADCLVKIPMAGKVESLNAAMAASILMFEVARQRRN
ncbi:MAG: RNA methyltransferase [bacterium]|nr:RNA methyltransferase [bacterium]